MQPEYESAVASLGELAGDPVLVKSMERAVVLEMFTVKLQAELLAFWAQLITFVKHCDKLAAPELLVYSARKRNKT